MLSSGSTFVFAQLEFIDRGIETPGKLIAILNIVRPQLSNIINRLQQHGYLTREPDRSDKRKIKLALTQAGEELLQQVNAIRLAKLIPVVASLSMTELEQFEKLFDKLLAHPQLELAAPDTDA